MSEWKAEPARPWRLTALWGAVALFVSMVVRADGETLKTQISSINGVAGYDQPTEMQVRPGDVISLSADLLKYGVGCENGCPLNQEVEDFIWTSSDKEG